MPDDKSQSQTPAAQPAQPSVPAAVDPFTAMRREMDRVFDRFGGGFFGRMPAFGDMFGGESLTRALQPTVDVHETADGIEIEAELPGVEEKDMAVAVRDGVLSIRAERRYEAKDGKGEAKQAHVVERSYGMFERAFRLPDTVDPDKIAASFDKGVLKVTAPKTATPPPRERRIEISPN